MTIVLFGIDGGGTKTSLAASTLDLKIINRQTGEASNHLKVGIDTAVRNLVKLINSALDRYEDAAKVLVLGTAGAGRKSDVELLETSLKTELPSFKKIKVVSDAEITLRGAFEDENGAILIAGTGSILYYKNDNKIKRVGGSGRIIGDEGSGYSIGRKAVNHLAKVFDGREEKTDLSEFLQGEFNFNSQTDLIKEVYKNEFSIAKAAKHVIEMADDHDKKSIEILNEEAGELVEHITAILKREQLDKLKLALSGGLFSEKNYYRTLVIKQINEKHPEVKVVEPKHKPEVGALIIAKELFNKEKFEE